jgi:hypothetical protein
MTLAGPSGGRPLGGFHLGRNACHVDPAHGVFAAVSGMGTRIFAAPVASVVAASSYFRAGFVERLVLQPGGKTLERGQWRLAGGVNLRISVLVQA